MGDEIELTTWQRHQSLYFEVTSSSLFVDIKATGNACIGLSRKPKNPPEYVVLIGVDNRSAIKKLDDRTVSAATPNALSPDEYRRFWIAWTKDSIHMGRDGNIQPILTNHNNVHDLRYVTFSTIEERNVVHWRFEVPPPYLKKPVLKPLVGGKVRWMTVDTQVPDEAVIGGFEREIIYIIRAHHRNSLTPGKFVPSEGVGYISWGGETHEKNEFEVLCGIDYTWVPTSGDKIPAGAIEAGYSEDQQERLFVGRFMHNGHFIPGKVQPSHRCCYIPYRENEVASDKYEILVAPGSMRSANINYAFPLEFDSEIPHEDSYNDENWHNNDDDSSSDSDDLINV